jgi:hypothetical protein
LALLFNDRVTRTPLKTWGGLRCSGRESSSCSTSGSLRVTLVIVQTQWEYTRNVDLFFVCISGKKEDRRKKTVQRERKLGCQCLMTFNFTMFNLMAGTSFRVTRDISKNRNVQSCWNESKRYYQRVLLSKIYVIFKCKKYKSLEN